MGFGHLFGKEPGRSPEVGSERPTVPGAQRSLYRRPTHAGQRSSREPFPARRKSVLTGVALVHYDYS